MAIKTIGKSPARHCGELMILQARWVSRGRLCVVSQVSMVNVKEFRI